MKLYFIPVTPNIFYQSMDLRSNNNNPKYIFNVWILLSFLTDTNTTIYHEIYNKHPQKFKVCNIIIFLSYNLNGALRPPSNQNAPLTVYLSTKHTFSSLNSF